MDKCSNPGWSEKNVLSRCSELSEVTVWVTPQSLPLYHQKCQPRMVLLVLSSHSFRCKIKTESSSFLRQAGLYHHQLPSQNCVCCQIVVSIFTCLQMSTSLISLVTHWLLSSIVFSLSVCVFLQFFFSCLFLGRGQILIIPITKKKR